jgi:hypothetical protein
MLHKALLFTLIAACGAHTNDAAAESDAREPAACYADNGVSRFPVVVNADMFTHWERQGFAVDCNPAALSAMNRATLARYTTPDGPDDREPPEEPPRELGQTFCCKSVDGNGTGTDCTPISHSNETIHLCANVLSCGEVWVKKDGKVTCL